jgi:hypothetical protein
VEWVPIAFGVLGIVACALCLYLNRHAFGQPWQIRQLVRPLVPKLKTAGGKHRASGLSSAQANARARHRAELAAAHSHTEFEAFLNGLVAVRTPDEFDTPTPGLGRWSHLRTDALDATAERALLLAERGIRAPSPWGTPELDDVWDDALVGAA